MWLRYIHHDLLKKYTVHSNDVSNDVLHCLTFCPQCHMLLETRELLLSLLDTTLLFAACQNFVGSRPIVVSSAFELEEVKHVKK